MMRYTVGRFVVFLAFCCCSVVLLVGISAPAGARVAMPSADSHAGAYTWVQVCDWSGGGRGNDQRHSDAFTLIGGQQFFSVSTTAVPGPYSIPIAGWSVEPVRGEGGFEMYYPHGMGKSSTDMFLPAGTYYVWSNTLDCWWSLGMWESRPTVSITGFIPSSGAPGTQVTITGTGFSGTTVVAFNGASAGFSVVSSTQITAIVSRTASTGKIVVTAPGGSIVSEDIFTVLPPTRLTSFTPTDGTVGTTVTLSGAGFTGATSVKFNGVSATFSVVSDTQISATVPAGAASGPITVTGPTGTGTSTASFTVMIAPTVSLKLSGLKSGAIKLGKSLIATGNVTPASLAGSKVALRVMVKMGTWATAKPVSVTVSPTGKFKWKYKPSMKGTYRMQAGIAETATCTGAATKWLPFKVK